MKLSSQDEYGLRCLLRVGRAGVLSLPAFLLLIGALRSTGVPSLLLTTTGRRTPEYGRAKTRGAATRRWYQGDHARATVTWGT